MIKKPILLLRMLHLLVDAILLLLLNVIEESKKMLYQSPEESAEKVLSIYWKFRKLLNCGWLIKRREKIFILGLVNKG